ncbi:MAG: P-II family nitrogen regulator [Verrucomicrobiota bacterium]
MKKIEALIKPFRFEEVKNALCEAGIKKMTTTEVKGFGGHKGHTEIYRSKEYTVDFLPNIKIELVVTEEQLDQVIKAIAKPAKTGNAGSDEILVSTIEQAACVAP